MDDSYGCDGQLLGDTNNDGYINVIDVVTIVNFILDGNLNFEDCNVIASDFNGDQQLDVLDVIEPGLNRERSLILKDLSSTKKVLLQRKLMSQEISEEEFSSQIQECVRLFNEHQECILMRFKKNECYEQRICTKNKSDDDICNDAQESDR